jgi:broad specificity phosphatase PhoE
VGERSPEPTRFLLVRHGQSTWNAIGRWQGRADAPLSATGEDQARQAAVELAPLGPFAVVVTSTLARARRTGELLADQAGIEFGGADEGLIERSAGAWEGLMRSEIEARYPNWLAKHRRPPGYEPDEEVAARAVRSLRALAEHHPGTTVVVVSHGGLITSLERAAGEEWRQLSNLEARWFAFDDQSGDLRPDGNRVCLLPAEPVPAETIERYA